MTLTNSLTKFSVVAATFAAAAGLMATGAETAAAATFVVEADIFYRDAFVGNSDVGDIFGSFDYDTLTNAFDNINLKSTFTGLPPSSPFFIFFPSFTATYDDFVSGSADTLTAKVKGPGFDGISLVFPDLNTLALNSSSALKSGSVTLISQEAELFARVGGSITAVPTPALLPGLIGLGVAALRRKNEESAEENA